MTLCLWEDVVPDRNHRRKDSLKPGQKVPTPIVRRLMREGSTSHDREAKKQGDVL